LYIKNNNNKEKKEKEKKPVTPSFIREQPRTTDCPTNTPAHRETPDQMYGERDARDGEGGELEGHAQGAVEQCKEWLARTRRQVHGRQWAAGQTVAGQLRIAAGELNAGEWRTALLEGGEKGRPVVRAKAINVTLERVLVQVRAQHAQRERVWRYHVW
jgi:hypothetical protein